jgi:hypothetical protein
MEMQDNQTQSETAINTADTTVPLNQVDPVIETEAPGNHTPVESPETADDEAVPEIYIPEQRAVNFKEELPTTSPLTKEAELGEMVAILREAYSTVGAVLERSNDLLENINKREEQLAKKLRAVGRGPSEDEGSAWFRTVMSALPHAQVNLMGEDSLARDGSDWRQVLEHEGIGLRAGIPKQKVGGGKHNASEMLTYISRRTGVGTAFDVPLYHSGVWVRLKTPTLAALSSLRYQLAQLRVSLGSDSKGLAFSNTAQALTSLVVDFTLQYVIDANIHYSTPSDLKEKISLLDAPVLLWGLAVTLFPKGYPYAHPCVADPDNCQHITKETLNLNRLFWTDSVSLSQTQRKLMAKRFQRLSDEEHKLYLAEHTRGNKRLVWFDDIGLTLKVPTVQEYEEAGRAWIGGIIDMTQGAFNEPPHGENRNNYITQLGMATTARQYAHWIADIWERDENGEESLLSDELEVINEALSHVFSTDEFEKRFFEEVDRFMDDSLISMVAIPSFNCPACHSPAAKKFHERFNHLVPLDVLTTFFTMVSLKHS